MSSPLLMKMKSLTSLGSHLKIKTVSGLFFKKKKKEKCVSSGCFSTSLRANGNKYISHFQTANGLFSYSAILPFCLLSFEF